jgi:Flp pilus assembly protein TadD
MWPAWERAYIGYANLRQFNDALVAATRAMELSPEEALLWRNIGHLSVTYRAAARKWNLYFDRALALSSDDADVLCGAALVAYRQGRMKDAGAIVKVGRQQRCQLPRRERWRERGGRCGQRRSNQARIVSPPLLTS